MSKEHLQQEIKKQIELGGEGLEEWDKWMLEVNLNDLNKASSEKEQYWIIAISTAYKMYDLRCGNNLANDIYVYSLEAATSNLCAVYQTWTERNSRVFMTAMLSVLLPCHIKTPLWLN